MPTRGSPALSSRTWGCSASQSISFDTSATSAFGSLRPTSPVDLPKPRADQVSTAYPFLGLLAHIVLAAAEAVAQQDGGAALVPGGGEVRGVKTYAVHRHHPVRAAHRGPVVGGDRRPGAGTGEHDDGGPGGQQTPGPPERPSQSKIHVSTVRGEPVGELSTAGRTG